MSLNSINTNIAAYSAQSNISSAANSASSSIARLSSGNRIVRAADDVASLSVGTSLRTGVTTLRQALANTNQGSSLLQVADGALGQVSEILQRQKAISVQANSGTLSDTERAYLNQEFQALSGQIDQIAGSTSFSSVKLLDGSLSSAASLKTNVSDSAQTTSGATAAAIITFSTAVPANGDKITVAGVSITFTTAAVGSADAAGKVSVGTTVTDTAANLVNFLNSSNDSRLSNLYFTSTAGAVSANYAGGKLSGAYVVDTTVVTAGTPANLTAGTAANRTIAVTNPVDGLGIDRTRALGTVSGSILSSGGLATVDAGSALNTRLIEDNQAFVGKIGGETIGNITAAYTAQDTATFSIKVGDITYSTAASDITNAASVALTFTGQNQYGAAAGGSFILNLKGGAFAAASINGQSDVDSIVAQLNDSLKGVTFAQNRDVTTFQEGQIASVGGVQVANLDGLSANFRTDSFKNAQIESVKITAPANGATDAKFEVVINGETYVSNSGIGNTFAINSAITLQSTTNANNSFSFVTGATALASSAGNAIDASTQAKADAVAKALEDALGVSGAGSKLNFQVGAQASDTIGVKISSISSTKLFGGEALDVTTIAGAQAASTALDKAIGFVNSVRADVGALQSRLDFTAANLESSIQNQDAARGTLLDTDVAAESTDYATAQVQLQAGIAVLAQANLLPQNLLKLIG